MDLSFDENGFLTPYTSIVSDLETVEKTFVAHFPDSQTRKTIFNNYLNYIQSIRNVIGADTKFYQWIDGSFVTNKLNPNDMDIVTFLETPVFQANDLSRFASNELHRQHLLDCYFVEVIPSDSRNYFFYQSDKMYWLNQFSFTKRNPKTDKRHEKGFIQINF